MRQLQARRGGYDAAHSEGSVPGRHKTSAMAELLARLGPHLDSSDLRPAVSQFDDMYFERGVLRTSGLAQMMAAAPVVLGPVVSVQLLRVRVSVGVLENSMLVVRHLMRTFSRFEVTVADGVGGVAPVLGCRISDPAEAHIATSSDLRELRAEYDAEDCRLPVAVFIQTYFERGVMKPSVLARIMVHPDVLGHVEAVVLKPHPSGLVCMITVVHPLSIPVVERFMLHNFTYFEVVQSELT